MTINVPTWLWAISDVLRVTASICDTDPAAAEFILPVCAIDCMDGALYYRVLSAWCVSWDKVPKGHFMTAWFALDADTRRELLYDRKAFVDELDEDRWMENMLQRDDADMLAAVLPLNVLLPGTMGSPEAWFIVRGAVECLILWAQRHGWTDGDWTGWSHACTAAAMEGHLGMLQLLRANGCPWDEFTCIRAALGGHLDCLMYAHQHGCPWSAGTCANAASGGHLDCLRYAHDHGCPWNEYTCTFAASAGHLECLRYAHEHGCAWDIHTCNDAVFGGHLDCLQYLHEHGCPWFRYTCAYAAGRGNLACLRYLHEQGCPWDGETCTDAVKGGSLECLVYAREHGCPWDRQYCLSVVGADRQDIRDWIERINNE